MVDKREYRFIGILSNGTSLRDEFVRATVGFFIDRPFLSRIEMCKIDCSAKGFKSEEGYKLVSIMSENATEEKRGRIKYAVSERTP